MNATRQIYKDVLLDEIPSFLTAASPRIDTIQLKYDGIWARVVVRDCEASLFSQTGALKTTFTTGNAYPCTLIGEYIFGSQWAKHSDLEGGIACFDCIEYAGTDLRYLPYIRRYNHMRLAVESLNCSRLFPVINYAAPSFQHVLDHYPHYEGLVFRSSINLYHEPLFRYKRSFCQSGFAVAFYEGTGRLRGALGSIGVADAPSGPEVFRCGGGFSDEERYEIWSNRDCYYNRELEVSAKKKFTSGALRHPNFERWKD